MDYDFITTCNWTATGTYTLRAYRGSDENMVDTYYASIFYRKKGTSTWTALNSSGQMVVNSTGEWEVANNWNKSGNDCLTHSYYKITAIDKCTDVYFNETSLGATVGVFFLCYCWYKCTSLSSMPSGFNIPTGITSVGEGFLYSCWNGCTSLSLMPSGFNIPTGITSVGDGFLYLCWNGCTSLSSMPTGFNLPTGITSVGGGFLYSCWNGCTSLSSMPSGFNIPTGITTVGNYFLFSCWEGCTSLASIPLGFNLPTGITTVGVYFLYHCWWNCTLLKADGYTEDIDFKNAAQDAFGGSCPIIPNTPTAGSSVAVNRPQPPVVAPTVTTQSATNIATISCTGNGNITATGGANCTRRGFCYKAGTSGDPTTSDSVAYDDGSFGTGAFTKLITGLSAETNYRVRAYAVNSAGTSYGTTVGVKTLSASNFFLFFG